MGTWSENGRVWGELNFVDYSDVVIVSLGFFFGFTVPDNNGSVVSTWGNESDVLGEYCASHPVGVGETKLKFAIIDTPDFDILVITGTDEELAIAGKLDTSDWGTVGLDLDWRSFNGVVPETNGFVLGTGGYEHSIGWELNITDLSLVAHKTIDFAGIFQLPYLNNAVICTGDNRFPRILMKGYNPGWKERAVTASLWPLSVVKRVGSSVAIWNSNFLLTATQMCGLWKVISNNISNQISCKMIVRI